MWKDWIECEYLLNRELFFFHLTLVPIGKAVGGAVTGGRRISGPLIQLACLVVCLPFFVLEWSIWGFGDFEQPCRRFFPLSGGLFFPM